MPSDSSVSMSDCRGVGSRAKCTTPESDAFPPGPPSASLGQVFEEERRKMELMRRELERGLHGLRGFPGLPLLRMSTPLLARRSIRVGSDISCSEELLRERTRRVGVGVAMLNGRAPPAPAGSANALPLRARRIRHG